MIVWPALAGAPTWPASRRGGHRASSCTGFSGPRGDAARGREDVRPLDGERLSYHPRILRSHAKGKRAMREREFGACSTSGDARLVGVVWLVGAVVLAGYVLGVAMTRTTHGFIAYYAAARLLAARQLGPWIYDDEWFGRYVREISGTPVREIFGPNPPAMAVLALPVAGLDAGSARGVWLAVSLAALLWASRWLARESARRGGAVAVGLVALMLSSPAVFANLRTGQAYLVLLGTFTAASVCLARRRDSLAGALLGFALLVKTSGLPLLLLLLAARRRRAVAAALVAVGAGAAGLALWAGAGAWRQYPRYVWAFVQRPSLAVTANQTTLGLARHLCVADPKWNPAPLAQCVPLASLAPAALIASALVVTAVAARRAPTALCVAAGLCLSVLALPFGEEHHFVLLNIPMMLVYAARAEAATARGLRREWPWLVFATLFLVPLDVTAHRFAAGWSALAAYPRLYAAWFLWGLAMREVLRQRARDRVAAACGSTGGSLRRAERRILPSARRRGFPDREDA
jgi:hypothetical protein